MKLNTCLCASDCSKATSRGLKVQTNDNFVTIDFLSKQLLISIGGIETGRLAIFIEGNCWTSYERTGRERFLDRIAADW